MRRIVILGRGAAGKTTLARRLGQMTGLPVIELDKLFWKPGLAPTSHDEWTNVQRELVTGAGWILDGDLGPYDIVEVRLYAADTIILLDFSLARCAWRAALRSWERADFWRWLVRYRKESRRLLMKEIERCAPAAELYVLRSPRAVSRFLEGITQTQM